MITEIPLIPEIPEELKIAARQRRLIPFIGAGVSQIAGCPGWSGFADQALDFLLQRGKVNHALVEQIRLQQLSPRIRLALALGWAEQAKVKIDFRQILHPEGWDKNERGVRVYAALSALSNHFVTTNYDVWLDTAVIIPPINVTTPAGQQTVPSRRLRQCIHRPEDILISALDRNDVESVIHLHGTINEPENMVLTTRHYVDRYASSRRNEVGSAANATQVFLEDLFRLKNVMFLGYGLDELEVLEYVILKSNRKANEKDRVARHFILQPFFSHELDVAKGVEAYFKNQCDVTLIPFLRDRNNYAQIIDVLESFTRDLSAGPTPESERRYVMERLLDEPT